MNNGDLKRFYANEPSTKAEEDFARKSDLTTIEANPTLAGTENALTGLQVGDTKYKVSDVVANPVLAGTEDDLTGLQVGDTKYKISAGGGEEWTPKFTLTMSNDGTTFDKTLAEIDEQNPWYGDKVLIVGDGSNEKTIITGFEYEGPDGALSSISFTIDLLSPDYEVRESIDSDTNKLVIAYYRKSDDPESALPVVPFSINYTGTIGVTEYADAILMSLSQTNP